jgi:cysteine synthase B
LKRSGILDSIGNTPLVELPNMSASPDVRVFAKLEGVNPTGSIKDRIALYMIERAMERGDLHPGQTIIEASTGNTGIALALVGRLLDHPVKVVVPESVVPEVVRVLGVFGAGTIWSPGSEGAKGAIDLARRLANEHQYYLPSQFENLDNPQAHYSSTAAELLADLPDIDAFIAGLGTGGTLMGVGRRLKEKNRKTKLIAVEPHLGSFVQGLSSLEDGFLPPILDLSLLDGKMVVTSRDSFNATKELLRREGIFAGVSSGAVLHCAQRIAQRMRRGNLVVILADGGWKYLGAQPWTQAHQPDDDGEADLESILWW